MDNTLINMISDLKSLYNFQAKKINEIDVLKKEHLETQDLLFEQIKSLQLKVDEVTQEYVEKVNELKHKSELDYETLKKEKENSEQEVIQLKQQKQVTYTELIEYIKNLQVEVDELKELNNTLATKIIEQSNIIKFIKKIIVRNRPNEHLHFSQVQVYDSNGNNIASNGIAEQSSLYPIGPNFGPAIFAIDGSNNTFNHTQKALNEWWSLTFFEYKDIRSIVIHNRQDCCQDRLNGATLYLIDQFNKETLLATLTGAQVQTYIIDTKEKTYNNQPKIITINAINYTLGTAYRYGTSHIESNGTTGIAEYDINITRGQYKLRVGPIWTDRPTYVSWKQSSDWITLNPRAINDEIGIINVESDGIIKLQLKPSDRYLSHIKEIVLEKI